MKQHISILMLLSRSTLYKLLILFLLMIGVESLLFWQTLNHTLLGLSNEGAAGFGLEAIFQNGHIALIFGICFLLQTAILSLTGCEFGSKQGYTLGRLRISKRTVFLWQALYDMGCYLLLWMVQIIAVLFLCQFYMTQTEAFLATTLPQAEASFGNTLARTEGLLYHSLAHIQTSLSSNQTIFLAFYRSEFLHSLLPLDDIFRWIRNILFAFGLGITAAAFPYWQRRGQISTQIIFLAAISFFTFSDKFGFYSLDGASILAVILSVRSIYLIFIKEKREVAV